MNELLKDWEHYCLGNTDFDKCHFNFLFEGVDDKFNVEEIYKHFPNTKQLVEKFNYRIPEYYKNLRPEDLESQLRDLVKADLAVKLAVLNEIGQREIAEEISGFSVKTCVSYDEYDAANYSDFNTIYNECFSDYMIGKVVRGNYKTSALIEALYWHSSDYNMVWFFIEPLASVNLNLSNYYIIRGLRANYCIADNCILILMP